MSPLIVQIIDETGKPKPLNPLDSSIQKLFPSQDIHNSLGSLHRSTATSIYKTNDGRFYHVHGEFSLKIAPRDLANTGIRQYECCADSDRSGSSPRWRAR